MSQGINEKLDEYLESERRATRRKWFKEIAVALVIVVAVASFYVLDRAYPTGVKVQGTVIAVIETPTGFSIKGFGVPERQVTIELENGRLINIENGYLQRGQTVTLKESKHRLTGRLDYGF